MQNLRRQLEVEFYVAGDMGVRGVRTEGTEPFCVDRRLRSDDDAVRQRIAKQGYQAAIAPE